MINTGQNISSIGATPYVPYSAIELVGNIQLTAFGMLILCGICIFFSTKDGNQLSKIRLLGRQLSIFIPLVALIVASFIRIWL